jgi:sugar phosphate isomerase/epimerase
MRISTEIGSIAKYVGEENAIRYLAEAGFDSYDFTMLKMAQYSYATWSYVPNDHPLGSGEYLSFVRHLRRAAEECGITCNQSHAPFPVFCPEIRDMLKRAIECTAEAGGKICVIHPNNHKTAEENREMFLELLPFAESYGVKIATENMWNWNGELNQASFAACSTPQDFVAHVDAVNHPMFGACLDIGHAEMKGLDTSAPEMIRALGHRLIALHLHDNDRWHDSHMIPFTGEIDFRAVVEALIDVGYQGDFTLEPDKHMDKFGGQDPLTRVKEMADSARRLVALYEMVKGERSSV